jgi:hypothetical protein
MREIAQTTTMADDDDGSNHSLASCDATPSSAFSSPENVTCRSWPREVVVVTNSQTVISRFDRREIKFYFTDGAALPPKLAVTSFAAA